MTSTQRPKAIDPRALRWVRRNYALRAIGLGIGSIGFATAVWTNHFDAVRIAITLAVGFAWPHLAGLLTLRAVDPRRVERRNLVVDGGFVGFGAALVGADLVPSAIGLVITGMNSLSVGGVRLWARTVLAQLAGIAVALLCFEWRPHLESNLATQIAMLPMLLVYLGAYGWGLLTLARELNQSRLDLRRLSETDALSGLANRRCLDATLELRFRVLLESGGRATLLCCDIDYFKQVNDRYGHAAGDDAIRRLGEIIGSTIRRSDFAARYGGDEFVILLDNVGIGQSDAFIERIRARLALRRRDADAGGPAITLSFGASEFKSGFQTAHEWLVDADTQLYLAKACRP